MIDFHAAAEANRWRSRLLVATLAALTVAVGLIATASRAEEREGILADLFAMHPPVAERIARLRGVA